MFGARSSQLAPAAYRASAYSLYEPRGQYFTAPLSARPRRVGRRKIGELSKLGELGKLGSRRRDSDSDSELTGRDSTSRRPARLRHLSRARAECKAYRSDPVDFGELARSLRKPEPVRSPRPLSVQKAHTRSTRCSVAQHCSGSSRSLGSLRFA